MLLFLWVESFTSKVLKVAGDNFDRSIIRYIRKEYNLFIGERTAEALKMNLGSAYQREGIVCKGMQRKRSLDRDCLNQLK